MSTASALLRSIGIVCASVLLGADGCDRRGAVGPSYPAAEAYERDPTFAGEWIGEVGEQPGVLALGGLGGGSFFGSFRADEGGSEYVLLLEHTMVPVAGGGLVPSNRMTFTWQDGLGGRGRGWLLINREDTALTGSFGYDQSTEGLGAWTFIRVDDAS